MAARMAAMVTAVLMEVRGTTAVGMDQDTAAVMAAAACMAPVRMAAVITAVVTVVAACMEGPHMADHMAAPCMAAVIMVAVTAVVMAVMVQDP